MAFKDTNPCHWCRWSIPLYVAWLAGYTLWRAPGEHVRALSIHTNAQLPHQFSLHWVLGLYSLPHIIECGRDCQLLHQELYILVWLAVDMNLDWWNNLPVPNGITLLNSAVSVMLSKILNRVFFFLCQLKVDIDLWWSQPVAHLYIHIYDKYYWFPYCLYACPGYFSLMNSFWHGLVWIHGSLNRVFIGEECILFWFLCIANSDLSFTVLSHSHNVFIWSNICR